MKKNRHESVESVNFIEKNRPLEMSCDDQIAKYLGTEANAQFKLLSLLLPQCQSSFRIQELALVILSNILRCRPCPFIQILYRYFILIL